MSCWGCEFFIVQREYCKLTGEINMQKIQSKDKCESYEKPTRAIIIAIDEKLDKLLEYSSEHFITKD